MADDEGRVSEGAGENTGCGPFLGSVLTMVGLGVGSVVVFVAVELMALTFAPWAVRGPVPGWGVTGGVLGAMVGFVVGLRRSGRRSLLPVQVLALAAVVLLVLVGADRSGYLQRLPELIDLIPRAFAWAVDLGRAILERLDLIQA